MKFRRQVPALESDYKVTTTRNKQYESKREKPRNHAEVACSQKVAEFPEFEWENTRSESILLTSRGSVPTNSNPAVTATEKTPTSVGNIEK